jgi:hypothetical protein
MLIEMLGTEHKGSCKQKQKAETQKSTTPDDWRMKQGKGKSVYFLTKKLSG